MYVYISKWRYVHVTTDAHRGQKDSVSVFLAY